MTERIANTIVVRTQGPLPVPMPPVGETRNNVPLEVLRKYSSPKPLFRPKVSRERGPASQDKAESAEG